MGGILIQPQILTRILNEDLILNPLLDASNQPRVEGSSYDLRAGTLIWKDSDTRNTKTLHFDDQKDLSLQAETTIHPGQMLFVITHEIIKMPLDLCATVFSRNQLSRDGILALNTGHIDPGYEGPIIIRLINLRAIPYTLRLGTPIYTIVFQKLDTPIAPGLMHPKVSKNDSIEKATRSVNEALSNALYDLALLNSFVKKDDFNQLFWSWFRSNVFKVLAYLVAIIGFGAAIIGAIQPLIDLITKYSK